MHAYLVIVPIEHSWIHLYVNMMIDIGAIMLGKQQKMGEARDEFGQLQSH